MRLRPVWIGLVVLGVAARVFAVLANDAPHGDVHLDALTLGALWDGRGFTTPLERSIELYPREAAGGGYPLDQHPPLSIVLAAAFPIGGDPYFALQVVSLLAGIVGLVLVHRLAGRILVDVDPWIPTALVAASFALADFAGNGSVYTLHGTLTLAAVAALARRTVRASLLAGAFAGLAYLTNYQALPLVAALAIVLVLSSVRGSPCRGRGSDVRRRSRSDSSWSPRRGGSETCSCSANRRSRSTRST
ncbi:MAG: glycosyltransferase family 39 protein [Planctomycetes bacterium]|nr:glycosyltransferase family 39 protein [Planctomycetota bacterium]